MPDNSIYNDQPEYDSYVDLLELETEPGMNKHKPRLLYEYGLHNSELQLTIYGIVWAASEGDAKTIIRSMYDKGEIFVNKVDCSLPAWEIGRERL